MPIKWSINRVLAVTFCLNTVYLLGSAAAITKKYADDSFDTTMKVRNRTVHCLGKPQGSRYHSPMYTCQDISVNQVKLFHAPAENKGRKCEGCEICGKDSGKLNDIHSLCKEMLAVQGVKERLKAAYVVNPTCASKLVESRVKFFMDYDGTAQWLDLSVSNGYVRTLQCSTEPPSTNP